MYSKKMMIELGKFSSYILRHGAKEQGLQLDSEGWLAVNLLINKAKEHNHTCNQETIEYLVENNSKKRYQLSEDKQFIRAVQGHSDTEVAIAFKEVQPPAILYHGTAIQHVESILRTGLNKQSRLYVHLSTNVETASQVGQRHGKLVLLEIDAKKMHEQGIKFYLSENNVWLTEFVAAEYIKSV